jgi:hypothetical protein
MSILLSLVFATVGIASAQAQTVCVTVDATRDNLDAGEQQAAVALVSQAFEAQGLVVDTSGAACASTYVVTNVRLGKTINVKISGPLGERTARASGLDDLSNVYSQMAISLVNGTPMETGGGSSDRTNVTKDQSAPRRVAADSLKYITLGYGVLQADGINYGPTFGFGYRKELDRIAIDFSFLNLMLLNDNDSSDGITGSFIKMLGLYYQDPIQDSSLYYGGGLSYGAAAATDSNSFGKSGSGMQGELVAGYEAFRSSTIRGFLQLNATLPFYQLKGQGQNVYAPYISAVVGFGWGSSNVVRVINE